MQLKSRKPHLHFPLTRRYHFFKSDDAYVQKDVQVKRNYKKYFSELNFPRGFATRTLLFMNVVWYLHSGLEIFATHRFPIIFYHTWLALSLTLSYILFLFSQRFFCTKTFSLSINYNYQMSSNQSKNFMS